jgi:nucleoporin GLE1
MAFPLAQVAITLISSHPIFQQILQGRFFKQCPYTIPLYIKRIPGEDEDGFRKRLRYKKRDDEWESEEQYNERICGIFAVYCAILEKDQGKQKEIDENSSGIEHGS